MKFSSIIKMKFKFILIFLVYFVLIIGLIKILEFIWEQNGTKIAHKKYNYFNQLLETSVTEISSEELNYIFNHPYFRNKWIKSFILSSNNRFSFPKNVETHFRLIMQIINNPRDPEVFLLAKKNGFYIDKRKLEEKNQFKRLIFGRLLVDFPARPRFSYEIEKLLFSHYEFLMEPFKNNELIIDQLIYENTVLKNKLIKTR